MPNSRTLKNAVCHTLDGIFFHAALVVFSRQVTMPLMVGDLSASQFVLGLIPLILSLGLLLPQVFHAKRVEGLAYKKPTVLFCAMLQRVGWAFFLVSLFIHWGGARTLVAYFVALAAGAVGSGLIVPVWTDWFAKTVPESIWGKVLGIRRAVSGVVGVALGRFFIGPVVAAFDGARRYQVLVGGALVFYGLSFLSVMLVQEDREPGLPNHSRTRWDDYLKGLVWILFRRRDFRRFMVACLFVSLPAVVMSAFLARFGLTLPGAGGEVSGTFTLCFFGAGALGSFLGGFLSDRAGALVPFRVFPLFTLTAAGLAFISREPATVSVAFAFLGFAFGAEMVVRLPALFRFAGPERRPSYMAVSFTVLGLGSVIVPPVMGLLLDARWLTFPGMFLVCGVLCLTGWLLFLTAPTPTALARPAVSGAEGEQGRPHASAHSNRTG